VRGEHTTASGVSQAFNDVVAAYSAAVKRGYDDATLYVKALDSDPPKVGPLIVKGAALLRRSHAPDE
jgi:hypothetical protein